MSEARPTPATSAAARPARERRRYSPRRSAADRREQVLDAALRLIRREGYRAVSVDAVARELDVTRPVVYRAFDGLDEMLGALLDRQEERALTQLMATVARIEPAEDVAAHLRRTITAMVAMVGENRDTWAPILGAALDAPRAVRERIERDRDLVRRRFQALVELSFGGSGMPPGVDSGYAAHALLAMAEHFGRMLLADPGSLDPQRLAGTVTALLAPGRRGSPRPSQVPPPRAAAPDGPERRR